MCLSESLSKVLPQTSNLVSPNTIHNKPWDEKFIYRFVSIYQLYNEWLGRGGLVTLHMLNKPSSGSGQNTEDETLHGGSVRCGSLLQHVPGDEYEYSGNLYTKNLQMLQQSQNIGIDFEDDENYPMDKIWFHLIRFHLHH